MKFYTITSVIGLTLGTYIADCVDNALLQLAEDLGFTTIDDLVYCVGSLSDLRFAIELVS